MQAYNLNHSAEAGSTDVHLCSSRVHFSWTSRVFPVISASPAANEPIIDVTQADGFQGVTGDFHAAVFATHPVCLAH